MRYILTANNITKCFFKDGKKFNAVDNVSFFLDKNEFCALVGESGSGKTTLIRIISGLISPDSGTVVCDGESLTPGCEEKIRLSVQNSSLFFKTAELLLTHVFLYMKVLQNQ